MTMKVRPASLPHLSVKDREMGKLVQPSQNAWSLLISDTKN